MTASRICRWGISLLLVAFAAAIPWVSGDPRTRLLGWNTLLFSGSVTAISVAVGAPLAFLVVRTDLAGRKTAACLLTVLLFIPLYLQAAAWQAGFATHGWFTALTSVPPFLDVWWGAIWIQAATSIPWVVLIVGLGLRFVEPELEEQALLNAGAMRVLTSVTCRRAWPAIGAAALWVAILAAGDMTVTNLFQIRTYAEEIYNQIQLGDNTSEFWASTSGILMIGWLSLAGLMVAAQAAPRDYQPSQRPAWRFRLQGWRWPWSLAVWFSVMFLVGVPLGSLIYKAGVSHLRTPDGWRHDWSLERCGSIVARSLQEFKAEFKWSLLIGSLAALGAVLVAVPLAWSARRGGMRAIPACAVVAICLALPGPTIGLGLIMVFNRDNAPLLNYLYDYTIAAPLVAQLVRVLPLAILILWHALASVPRDLLDTAASEGAGRFSQLVRIALPMRWPALAIAGLVCLAVALGEVSASILVMPPGKNTLALRIFALIHYGVDDYVAGICLALVAILAFIAGIVLLIARRLPR